MYFNRFDIVTAHYVFNALHHEGQWSDRYKRLSKILSYFRPSRLGIDLRKPGYENAKEIYIEICRRKGVESDEEMMA